MVRRKQTRPKATVGSAKPAPVRKENDEDTDFGNSEIAHLLHTTVCQSITGARFLVSVIEREIPATSRDLRRQVRAVERALRDASLELRKAIRELRGGRGTPK